MAGWLNSLKDTALAATVRKFLGSKLEGYGIIKELEIDTKLHRIDLEIVLQGEAAPIQVKLQGYEILETEGITNIAVSPEAFETSRAWLTKLLNTQVAGRSFALPDKYAKYARTLVG